MNREKRDIWSARNMNESDIRGGMTGCELLNLFFDESNAEPIWIVRFLGSD